MCDNARFRLSGSTLLPDGLFQEATLQLENGQITEIQPGLDRSADLCVAGLIVPGFIDLQFNGGFGFDFTADPGSVAACAASLPETGVTGFQADLTILDSKLQVSATFVNGRLEYQRKGSTQ